MSERPGSDGIDPSTVSREPARAWSTGEVAVGRAMLGVGDILEGKPAREVVEHVVESDQSGEPEDPENPGTLVLEL